MPSAAPILKRVPATRASRPPSTAEATKKAMGQITAVRKGSPGAQAGLQLPVVKDVNGQPYTFQGDVIVQVEVKVLANGFERFDADTALVAYAESLVAGKLLCERLGPNVGTFLQMLGSGHTVDQALSTLDVRPEAFYAEWLRRIGIE